jgi:hypothetical protein
MPKLFVITTFMVSVDFPVKKASNERKEDTISHSGNQF